ncbi:MAG: AMP-binding protein [Acidimicrobiales bacterium]|nr:AMP-binding protein [Acidimicrobiales bacterium]
MNVAELVLARAEDDNVGLRIDDETWTFRSYVEESVARAHLLLAHKPADAPFHVGVLLENVADYVFLLGGAAIAGATVVGINPTRRGAELERDIRHTDCAVLITEMKLLPLLEGVDTGVGADATYVVDSPRWSEAVESHRGSPAPDVDIDEAAPFLLIFTSGTSGDPKASICSQRRIAEIGPLIAERRGIAPGDTLYCSMPLFHGNGMMSGWIAALGGGATLALRRKFSASSFLPDVRRYGATHANYVGKVLAYVLATVEAPDDADNTLRFVYGNEGAAADLERFAARFDCQVSDAYGSSEGGVTIFRVSGMPETALGIGGPGTTILDAETGEECPRARFDEAGALVNVEDAVGEIARVSDDLEFEGYWNNPDAQADKTRDGIFWTGDLGYRDDDDFIYFVGRDADWMRVDGENIAAVTIERIVSRHPRVGVVAAYAVPDPIVGDQVMLALRMADGEGFDPSEFASFLADQADLGTKATPQFVRVADELPMTATNKVLSRALRREFWECADPVWVRRGSGYEPLTDAAATALRAEFATRGRLDVLGVG